MAATTGAFAQSATARVGGNASVEMFGVLDATVTRLSVTDGGSVTQLSGDGRNQSSRLGFRGTEDLGGGLSAAFWLEAAINVDNGTGSNTSANNTAAGDKIAFGASSASNSGLVSVPANQSLTARQGLTFNRASTVSVISKALGELRLGRDYNPSFWNYTAYDPFGAVGVGSALNVIGGPLAPAGVQAFPPGAAYPMVRASNSIGWLSQDMNGFRAQLQYALSEQPSLCTTPESTVNGNYCYGAKGDGKELGGRLSYANGPLSAAVAYSKTSYGDVAAAAGYFTTDTALKNTTAIRGDYSVLNVAGSYDLGMAKLFVQYGTQGLAATTAASEKKMSHYLLGAALPMGPWTHKITFNAAKRDDAAGTSAEIGSKGSQVAIGTQYDFSKRTAFYATYSSNKLTAGSTSSGALRATLGLNGAALAAGTSGTATGLDVGIRHSF